MTIIKSADIHFRVTTEMKERLICYAADSGESLSECCERACRQMMSGTDVMKEEKLHRLEKAEKLNTGIEKIEKEQKNCRVAARVTKSEYDEICNQAKLAGVSVSEYIRYAAMRRDIVTIIDGREMQRQLSKIGGNLNQLTILARMGRITCPELGFVQRTLGDILKELIKMKRKK